MLEAKLINDIVMKYYVWILINYSSYYLILDFNLLSKKLFVSKIPEKILPPL